MCVCVCARSLCTIRLRRSTSWTVSPGQRCLRPSLQTSKRHTHIHRKAHADATRWAEEEAGRCGTLRCLCVCVCVCVCARVNCRYTAAKRFGLEGAESLIPGMKALIDTSADLGVQNIVIGMPHRGGWGLTHPTNEHVSELAECSGTKLSHRR